jgi:hypothetical protein
MKMKITFFTTVIVMPLLFAAGCESDGLSPRETARINYPRYILNLPAAPTNSTINKVALPIRLAVVQIGEVSPSTTLLEQLARDPSSVSFVTGLPLMDSFPGESYPRNPSDLALDDEHYRSEIKQLCRQARSVNTDYVFLFGGTVDTRCKDNDLSTLDFTIVGAFIIPANEIHLDGRGAGCLIDAATASPILFVNADASRKTHSPDALASGKAEAMRRETADILTSKLGDELLKRLVAFRQSSDAAR